MALNRNEVGLQFVLTVDSVGAVTEIKRITNAFITMGNNIRQEVGRINGSLDQLAKAAQRTGERVGDSFREPLERARQSTSSLQEAFTNLGNVLTVGVTLPLAGLSAAAIKSAVDLDKTRARLAALMGSTEEANRVIGELNKLVAQTPGLTSAFAMDAFAQMRALGTIGEESIMKLTASLGRLNAVFTLQDPQQFIRNITQIFTQSFERADIKEALGQVPIFEQLLEQAFGTKDASKLRQLKDAGATQLIVAGPLLETAKLAITNEGANLTRMYTLDAAAAVADDSSAIAIEPFSVLLAGGAPPPAAGPLV
jgi:phage tail tape-measure protein